MFSLSVVHFQTSGLIKQFMEKLDQIMIFIKIIWEMLFFPLLHTTTYWIVPTKTMTSSSNIMVFFKFRGDVFPNNLH